MSEGFQSRFGVFFLPPSPLPTVSTSLFSRLPEEGRVVSSCWGRCVSPPPGGSPLAPRAASLRGVGLAQFLPDCIDELLL